MFVQGLFYVVGILGFLWLCWKWLIVPILKEKGIEYDDVKTSQTKQLEKLKEEYRKMDASTQAAEEGIELMKEINDMKTSIKEAEAKIKEMRK